VVERSKLAAATLLVVDDNEDNRDVLARRLERAGYVVPRAANGTDALHAVERGDIDLVLLDIMMPGLSGIDVLQKIRERHTAARLPVVMVTARAESQEVVHALELGANDYVTKPLDFPVVLARVRAHLRTRAEGALATADDRFEAREGALLAGRYRLEERIGGGTFGSVWRATHNELEQRVAIKVLASNVVNEPDALSRFRREGISGCRVRHPNAVAVFDFGALPDGVAYLVMELLEGHSLDRELAMQGQLTPERAVTITVPVLSALAEAHRAGVVHRDVKPANIFLHRTPKGEVPKVLDFGIARLVGESALAGSLTLDGSVLGTPSYMAPERFRNQLYGPRSDVYSVGVMLYQMVSGRLPFVARAKDPMAMAVLQATEPPPALREAGVDVSPALERAILAALAKESEQRPSAEELARSLERAVGPPADAFTPLDGDS
jgi:DNA-binding response OmpR family regulator/tRNA A-37 threonylcarbamoyl transferase component Bud32